MENKDQNVEGKPDCLTEFSEPLLHHILSYLTMKDVIRTSILAKWWRYKWMDVPCLTFSPLKKKTLSKQVAFITRTLLLHKGLKIQMLNITSYCDQEALLVDSWIQFALTRSVNQLYLDFSRSYRSMYTLHDMIFSCSSLTVLALKGCKLQLLVKAKLRSLKTMSFENVKFVGGAVNDFLSSCSILEDLSFANCHWGNNRDLIIMNSAVKTLKMLDYQFSQNSTLQINAPFIVSFESTGGLFPKQYVIKTMESLCSASFVCSKSVACDKQVDNNFGNLENLENLCHVKDLRMCSCYIQELVAAISSAENLMYFREKHVEDFISFDVTCLRIKTGLRKWEWPGIAYVLSHSPNVETLIISIDKIEGKDLDDNLEEEYCQLQEPNFVDRLCSLKDVKIFSFMKNLSVLDSKQMSTTEEFVAHLQNNMNFVKFLLKNSKFMERMTITTFKKADFGGNSKSKKLKLLVELTEELLAYPRASPAAQISFN